MYQLNQIAATPPPEREKAETKKQTELLLEELDELQNLLYAGQRHSLLVVLQGLDASGKDGLIRKVLGSLNPQGLRVQSFKVPTAEELGHDFLWRIHPHVPARGMIQVFNRSHYEDVLVTRVHGIIDEETARDRMRCINDFEHLLQVHNNTLIVKCYLHVSAAEQAQRLEERKEIPRKMWKYNANDQREAALRDAYLQQYEKVFAHCNQPEWHIIASDKNWWKEYLVALLIRDALKGLEMKYPPLEVPGS